MGHVSLFAEPVEDVTHSPLDAANRNSVHNQVCQTYWALNRAIAAGEVERVKFFTSNDHRDVTHVGSSSIPLWQRIGKQRVVGYGREIVSDVLVEEIAPGVAMQSFEAKMHGVFEGVPIPERVAVTIIWQKQDGRWVERFYQHTALDHFSQ